MPDPIQSALFTPDMAAQYRKVLGVDPIFTTRPNVAAALAQGNADRNSLEIVAGFLNSLELAKQVRLARAGGAKMFLSDQDRAYLQVLGEEHADIDAQPVVQAIEAQNNVLTAGGVARSDLGTVANFTGDSSAGFVGSVVNLGRKVVETVSHVSDVPVLGDVLEGLNIAADATRGGVRLISQSPTNLPGLLSYGQGVGSGDRSVTDVFNTSDLAEAKRAMRERGYDSGNPIDVFQFWAKGKQNYHNLDDLRREFGEGTVRAAQEYLENPELFADFEGLSDDQIAARIQATNDSAFRSLVTRVDARHMSAGRDLANTFGLEPGSRPFTLTSGAMDALESWFIDPTIVGGKLTKVTKFKRRGIDTLVDAEGIRRVMSNNASVQRGWQQMLDRAKVIREGTDVEKAAALAAIRSATPELVPLVSEVNGMRRAIIDGKLTYRAEAPIENMGDLTEYLVAQNALTRTVQGLPPRRGVFMPGAVSRFAQAKAGLVEKGALRAGAKHEDRIIDLSKDAAKVFPDPSDFVEATTTIPSRRSTLLSGPPTPPEMIGEAARRGDALAKERRSVRGRALTAAKRFSTLMPDQTKLDFYDPKAVDQVLKWAQIYMPKTEARILAAKFSAGDLADRRLIHKAMMEQTIHAAGLESSATGREMARRLRGDLDRMDMQRYSLADGADVILDDAGSRRVAIAPGQVDTEMWLPSFSDLQKGAAKVSLYDHSLRRVLDSDKVETLMTTMRGGWLMTFANASRNILDSLANAAVRGQGIATVRARASLSEGKALRALERELVVPDDAATFATQAAYHKARISRPLQSLKATVLSHASSAELDEAAELLASELGSGHLAKLGFMPTGMVTGAVDPQNIADVAAITKAGFRPAEIGFKKFELSGWGEVAADGGNGARAWAINLDHYVADHPELAKRLVTAVRGQQGTTKGVGSVVPDMRLEQLAQHIAQHPEMERFREFAEVARGIKDAPDELTKLEAGRQVADRMVRSFEALTVGRDGQPIHNLLDRLESGQVPSLDWLAQNVPTSVRPDHVIGRQWAPVAAEASGVLGFGQMLGRSYTTALSRGYELVVAKPIAELASHPIFAANVVKARRNLAGYHDSLVAGGMDWEAARLAEKKLALEHAMDMTSRMIDNPEVASQMATISRNLVNFPRAAEDWVRRWGRTIMEDPSRIRKIQLAFEGGQHAGIVDRDDRGNLIFTYPGSGAAINAVLKAGEALKIPHVVSIPTVPDLKSQVLFLNPSLDNPFFPGFSPVVTTPLKMAQGFLPEHGLLLQDLQVIATGSERGASQGVFEQFFPTVVRNLFKNLTADEQSAQLSSAAMNAIVHMDAAGLVPDSDASPDDRDAFLQRVRTAAKNQLVVRSIFAFALPASPSLPENEAAGSESAKADAVFQAQGISSLKDEFRVLVAKLGYERALSVWTKVHPDELAYTVGRSEAGSPYGSVAPTREAQEWIEANLSWVQANPDIAAYFVPDSPGEFSPEAYRAQLEMGLRSRKGLEKFYADVRIINAERQYYAARELRDKAIAEGKAAGDSERVARVRANWTAWTQGDGNEPGFLNLNPLFAEKLASYGERTVWREQAVAQLERMVRDGAFGSVEGTRTSDQVQLTGPTGKLAVDRDTAGGVSALLQAYKAHTAFTDKMRGRRDKEALAAKDNEQRAYAKHMLSITGGAYDGEGRLTGGNPALVDLYQGLFRGLD